MDKKIKLFSDKDLLLVQAALRMDDNCDEAFCAAVQHAEDWPRAIAQAKKHGVLPLFIARLREAAPEVISGQLKHIIEQYLHEHELRVFLMTADLVKVVRAFEKADIPIICLKGVALSVAAYSATNMRDFVDIDVLIHARDIINAEKVLLSLGLVSTNVELLSEAILSEKYIARHRHRDYLSPVFKFSLEVHWKVTSKCFPFALPTEELFRKSEKLELASQAVQIPGRTDRILHAILHGTQHSWVKLSNLTDLAVQLKGIDADELFSLLREAEKAGLRRAMLMAIDLCQEVLGLPVPKEFATSMQHSNALRLFKSRILKNLNNSASWNRTALFSVIFNRAVADSHQLAWVTDLFFSLFRITKNDHQWLPLPANMAWLYYLLRPIRIIIKIFRNSDG